MTTLPTPEEIGYGKITIHSNNPDGTIRTETQTIQAGAIKTQRYEIEKSIRTSRNELIGHMIDSIAILTDRKSPSIDMKIYADKGGTPDRIVIRYSTEES